MNEKDKDIVASCKNGDRESQKMLYKHFYGYAMSICLRYSKNREDAIEVLNDSFLKVFKKLDTYDQEKPFKAWLRRILINTSLDYIRLNKKHFYHSDIDHVESAEFVEEIGLSSLSYEEILAMVQSLPPSYKTVFNLYVIDGYSHQEIAEMLKISEGTSKSNLFKARMHLKKILKITNEDEYAKYA